ncbi:S-adenosyl-L-methionine-dependent methyltransferase [Glarea lozoyensis ATCC 20868]|uniref:S-adenosyl-L-methionine-dependent methyltransferase n=1 Tax=Glarea lozoyensis (strain ATCC 20868 / MF5171) TaxID=1116229 RepID=S3CEA3_GLAL2|nr:S-adenosyl-L-methionine-dependent methyltransferase [Glarea lozoyensis ATCC 20868]EPE24315.1 S-adenosyl-L-methionine-dependent methyltransferase [Glarea lozoyensis ATCC 20868]
MASKVTAKPGYMLSRGFSANTSIWLIEIARELPHTVHLDGIDINFGQCPPKEWLAENITWVTQDIFSDPPAELREKYDVIHVQLFITLIRDGNPVPMLKNLIKMLKPGGYISWGEWDVATWEVIRAPSASSQTNGELEELKEYTSTLGKTRPGPSFISSGFNGVSKVIVDRQKFSTEIATLLLDTWIMASQEIAANVLDGLGGGQGDVARALIEEVGRNRGNTAFNLERVVTIGRKPLD